MLLNKTTKNVKIRTAKGSFSRLRRWWPLEGRRPPKSHRFSKFSKFKKWKIKKKAKKNEKTANQNNRNKKKNKNNKNTKNDENLVVSYISLYWSLFLVARIAKIGRPVPGEQPGRAHLLLGRPRRAQLLRLVVRPQAWGRPGQGAYWRLQQYLRAVE